jgi:hypothetical protein
VGAGTSAKKERLAWWRSPQEFGSRRRILVHQRSAENPASAAFPLLSRVGGPWDRLPLAAAEAVERYAAGSGSDPSLSVTSARRVPVVPGLPSWVLGDSRLMCLVRSQPLPKTSAFGYVTNCVRTSQAKKGYLVSSLSEVPQYRGATLFEGLLPNGADHVVAVTQTGARQAIATHEGAYAIVGNTLRSLRFRSRDRTDVVPLPAEPHFTPAPVR